jgi:hypothetical protein
MGATNNLELFEPTKYMAIMLWLRRPGEKWSWGAGDDGFQVYGGHWQLTNF